MLLFCQQDADIQLLNLEQECRSLFYFSHRCIAAFVDCSDDIACE